MLVGEFCKSLVLLSSTLLALTRSAANDTPQNVSDRHRGGGLPPTPATPPYVRVRIRRFEKLRRHSSTSEGRPSDLKYAFESPTERALAFARYQGPSPLPAVLLASRERTPSSIRASRRRRGVFHCRHIAALSRIRTQRVRPINTSGVSQNPK